MPLPFLSSRVFRSKPQESTESSPQAGHHSSESPRFSLPSLQAIPGARPRHKLHLPAEPVPAKAPAVPEDIDRPLPPPALTVAPENGRHVTNPIYFGFMLAVGVALALMCIYFILNVGALAGWLTGAVFIGLGLDPAVRKLEQRGLPRGAGVGVVFLVFATVVAVLILWIIPMVAKQAVSFITGFPQQLETFLNSEFFTSLDARFNIRSALDSEVEKAFTQVTSDTSVVSGFMSSLVNAGSTLAEVTSGIIIVLFLSIYVLASLPTIKAWFIRLAPASRRERVGYLTEKISNSVGQYVMGQALVALCNATVASIIMLIVGVPFTQLLMLFVLILAFIPLIGGISAALLVSLVSLIDSWQTAVFFLIPYLIYLQIEAYFISPRIMNKAVAVPGAVAIIAVVAGGSIWGILGAIIAIPVAASLLILVNEVLVPRQDQL